MAQRVISREAFEKMYEAAFQKKAELGIAKISGGLKNRVYLVDDGKNKYVFKTGPLDNKMMAPVDRNTISWEAKILKELEDLDIGIPHVIYSSDGIEEYPYPFMFLNYLPGNNYLNCKENLTVNQKREISYAIGQISRKICDIKKDHYFVASFPRKKFHNNYEFVSFLFELLLKTYKKSEINVDGITGDEIANIIEKHKDALNTVSSISLCNIDLWDGNILVKDGKISGIVDFNDTFYCDELMSFYFHLVEGETDDYFLLGYGKKELNSDEKIRVEIYRLYVVLKMIVDCEIKHYGRFGHIYSNFIKIYNKLLNMN